MAKNSNKRGGGSHNGKKSPRKGKFQGGKWLLTGFALTAIALVSAGAGSLLAMYSTPLGQSKLTPEQAAVFGQKKAVSYKNLNIPQLSRPINVLVLGTKVLTSEEPDPSQPNPGYHALVNSVEGLTDTMVLIRLDPKEKSLVVLSIPRDTRVEIPGYSGARKINQANALGGPALAAMTVTDLLGDVPIDRYIRVNVQAVEKLIDALGGVDVYVPRDMKYQDDSQRLYINLKEGQQRLDGEKALQMLRFRYDALGDIGRIQRQQIVMRAVVEQALKPQTILRIPDIVKILQSNIDTNLNMEELVAIAGFSAQIPREDVKMLMLPGDFNGTGRTSVSYWLPHQRKIQAMTEEYFGAMATNSWLWDMEMEEDLTTLDPYALRIAIQDSTDRPQAVKALVKELETAGYSRINVVSAFSQPLQTTRVIAQQGDHLGARQVRNSIGLGEVLVDSNGYLISDVTIQIGADWP